MIDPQRQLYTDHLRNRLDIVMGTRFDILLSRKNPTAYKMVDAAIDFVSLKKDDNMLKIPAGYGGVCRISFNDHIPGELNNLLQGINGKYNDELNDLYYLTTRPVMNKIIEYLSRLTGKGRREMNDGRPELRGDETRESLLDR